MDELSKIYDFLVVGGGIVGVATAWQLSQKHPGSSILVVEKEKDLAQHQTGHNSGVIHAGIYYEPGSLKAEFCRRGAAWTKQFARDNDIPFRECGKLIVATSDLEMERLAALELRAELNGIEARRIDASELADLEPNIAALGALLIPETGIIDYRLVTAAMADHARDAGVEFLLGAEVTGIEEESGRVTIATTKGTLHAEKAVFCGGLQADRLARLAGLEIDFQIIPFRGEYFDVAEDKRALVEHLIYPVPDPEIPFLGVHLSPMIDGTLTVGPNAVLGLAREKYPKFSINVRDAWEMATYPAIWHVALGNLRMGIGEAWNSVNKRGYLKECRKYAPSLALKDLVPREAGIRAQAVMRDGSFQHDFLIKTTDRMVHVVNAPSPAATSAMPIAEHIISSIR
jgi:L-2-hydroxyglutarate oxidase